MRGHKLAGYLLALLGEVLETGYCLDSLCCGAGLPLAFAALLAPRPAAPRPKPLLPRRYPRPVARPRARRRPGFGLHK